MNEKDAVVNSNILKESKNGKSKRAYYFSNYSHYV